MNQKLNHPILEQIKENDGTRRRIIRKEKEKNSHAHQTLHQAHTGQ